MYTMLGGTWGLGTGISSTRDNRDPVTMGERSPDTQTAHETRPPCSHLTGRCAREGSPSRHSNPNECVCLCSHACETWHQQAPHGKQGLR